MTPRSVTRLRRPMTLSSLKQLVPPLSQKQTDKSWFTFGYPFFFANRHTLGLLWGGVVSDETLKQRSGETSISDA